MENCELGCSALEVFPLCFGGNVLGWTIDEAQSFRILDAFVAAGGNFIDTADAYSRRVSGHQGGESENILGKWIKHCERIDGYRVKENKNAIARVLGCDRYSQDETLKEQVQEYKPLRS